MDYEATFTSVELRVNCMDLRPKMMHIIIVLYIIVMVYCNHNNTCYHIKLEKA